MNHWAGAELVGVWTHGVLYLNNSEVIYSMKLITSITVYQIYRPLLASGGEVKACYDKQSMKCRS